MAGWPAFFSGALLRRSSASPAAQLSSYADLHGPAAPRSPSNALPQAGLLVEAIQLKAAEVEAGNNPDDLAIVDDWQMAEAAVFHQPQSLYRRVAGRHRVGITGHDLGQGGSVGILALRQHAVHGVTAGEDADEAAISLDYQYRADAAVPHALAGVFDRGVRWQRDRVLVPDHVGHLSHPVLSSRMNTSLQQRALIRGPSRSVRRVSCVQARS